MATHRTKATRTAGFDPFALRARGTANTVRTRTSRSLDVRMSPARIARGQLVGGGKATKATTDLAIALGEVLTCVGVRDASMARDRRNPSETGRVILFRPRQATLRQLDPAQSPKRATGFREPPSAREDDDRHRRFIHLLGLAFCLVLAIAGVWLANEFTRMKRIQDCVLSGRTGCIPLNVVAHRNF